MKLLRIVEYNNVYRHSVRARAADAIGDNDIHKTLTALCKQCSSSASRQLQDWMTVRRFEIFHKWDQSQYSPPPAIMCVHDAIYGLATLARTI